MLVKSHERCYEKLSVDGGALFAVKLPTYTLQILLFAILSICLSDSYYFIVSIA